MFKDSRNLTSSQQKVRIVVGVVLLLIALFWLTDLPRVVVIVSAVYSLVTGVVSYCPITEILKSSKRAKLSRTKRRRR